MVACYTVYLCHFFLLQRRVSVRKNGFLCQLFLLEIKRYVSIEKDL